MESAIVQEYITNKELSIKTFKGYMITRVMQMFKYKNLPKTIPHKVLEKMLITKGQCFLTKFNDELFIFEASFGGEPDVYFRPTNVIISNPALRYFETLKYRNLDGTSTDCGVRLRNDENVMGLEPMMNQYASLLAENLITMRSADIMLRILAMITAPDDITKKSADIYLKQIENGELSSIGESRFFDGVKMQSPPSNNGSYLTQFIELNQYLKGSFYNEIGLNANYNMKRESISKGESSLNEDILLPLAENMLKVRQEDWNKVNELYGTDVEVCFDSSWRVNELETIYDLQKKEKDAKEEMIDGEINGEKLPSTLEEQENPEDYQEFDNIKSDNSQLENSEKISEEEQSTDNEETSQLENSEETSQLENSEETSQLENSEETSQLDNSEETSQLENSEEKSNEEEINVIINNIVDSNNNVIDNTNENKDDDDETSQLDKKEDEEEINEDERSDKS